MSVECAESNPYVKALRAHRSEMASSGLHLESEAVDSLPSRLATERSDALATLAISEMEDSQPAVEFFTDCRSDSCRGDLHTFTSDVEFALPHDEIQRHGRFRTHRIMENIPSPVAEEEETPRSQVSTEQSTTAGSLPSQNEARDPFGRRTMEIGDLNDPNTFLEFRETSLLSAHSQSSSQASSQSVLRLRVGKCRLELSEDDRSDFLSALVNPTGTTEL